MARHALLSASSAHRWINCPPSARLCEDMADAASSYAAEGTADCIVVADGTLTVVDFKYGLGVLVSAEGNEQMMCYALGALELLGGIYDIETVRMIIYQPRRDNLSTCDMGTEELIAWAEGTLKPAAELAFSGGGKAACGQWCGFCKAKATCRARAEANLELARHEFRVPPLLEDDDVENILDRLDELVAWASDIKDYALKRALSGKSWAGFKLVEGRSNWRYVDDEAVAKINAAIEAAYAEGQAKLKGSSRTVPPLSAIKTPLRDGDVERPDDPAYANAYFINANSATAPGIVDADLNPVLNRSEVYSGVYGRASINLYAFNTNGNRGVACGLNNLQLIRPGEPLGGKASPEADFGFEDDFLS